MPVRDTQTRSMVLWLLMLLLVGAGLIIAAGTYFAHLSRNVEAYLRDELHAVVDVKVNQVVAWRKERTGDGNVLQKSAGLIPALDRVLASKSDAAAERDVRVWLQTLLDSYGYANAILLDTDGRVRLIAGQRVNGAGHYKELAAATLAAGKPVFRDLHRDEGLHAIHLGMNVPLNRHGAPGFSGVLLLGIDANQYLYPLIARWPTNSPTAETLLVRRDGSDVLFLNETRHLKGTALTLRRPLTPEGTPSARAVLGKEGFVKGKDYRGVPVFAVVRMIPDSPWFLVAKVDAAELQKPLHQELFLLGIAVFSLIIAAAAGTRMLWRRQQARFYRQKYEAELERRALLGHYDYLSRYAHDVILLLDESGRIVEANDRAASTYRLDRKQLLERRIQDLTVPELAADFERHWEAAARSDGYVFETRQMADGSQSFPAELSIRPIQVEGSKFRQSIIRDITERKAMEERLRDAGQRLEAVIGAAPAGIVALDLEGHVQFWNLAAQRMSGWTSEEASRQPIPEWGTALLKAAAAGISHEPMEGELRRRDGSMVDISVTSAPVRDSKGTVTGAIAVIMDISEKRRAEKSVRESEERFRRLAELTPVAILIQHGTTFTYVNPAAVRLFGAESAEDLIGKNLLDRVPPEDRELVAERARQACIERQLLPMRMGNYVRLDGTRVPVEVCAGPFTGPGKGDAVIFATDVSERRSAQEALRESERRVQMAVQAAGIGLWDWNIGTNELYHSPECTAMLGDDQNNLVTRWADWKARLHPDDRARVVEELEAYLEAPRTPSYESEYRVQHRDGSYRWVISRGSLITGKDGKPIRMLGSLLDFTERKRMEQELEQSRRMVDRMLNAVPDLLYIYDLRERKNVFGNRLLTESLGYDQPQLAKMGPDLMPHLVHPGDLAQVVEHHRRCTSAAEGEVLEVEYRMRHADGSWRWLHSRDVAFERDPSGTVIRILGAAQDVTRRRRVEDALRISESRLGNAQRMASLGNWEYIPSMEDDAPGAGAHYWSDEVFQILGVGKEDFKPNWETFCAMVHPEDRDRVRKAFRGSLKSGRMGLLDHRVARPDGTIRYVRQQAERVLDATGQVRIAGTVQDITDLKHLQDQFLQAQRLESVGRLAGGVAHDFNNLLTVIVGYSELMLERPGGAGELTSSVEEIHKAAERATALTEQLLAFSRKQVVQPKIVNLNASIRDTENMLRRLIGEDIELVIRLAPELHCFMADQGQVNQVLMNLAVNARDAMASGGKLILETRNVTVADSPQDRHQYLKPGKYAELVVSDTGCGMDEDTRNHLFEPFFTTKGQGKGTGLGLSTVYGIVTQAGGAIWVYSEKGVGSTFHICLPAIEEQESVIAAAEPDPAKLRGTETLLVVEDQKEVRLLAKEILEAYGYHVLEADCGRQALEVTAKYKDPIDLVVTDVVMPEMTGRELATRLAEANPGIRILFMSGYTDDVIVHQGVLEPGVAYLQKPFSPVALATRVRQMLDSASG